LYNLKQFMVDILISMSSRSQWLILNFDNVFIELLYPSTSNTCCSKPILKAKVVSGSSCTTNIFFLSVISGLILLVVFEVAADGYFL
jgi:hypothetical protein